MSSSSRSPAASPAIPRGVGTPLTLLVTGFVLLLTLGGTWLAWESVGAHDTLAIRADFDFRARDVGKRILQRMNAHEQVLLGVAGLFAGSEVVSRTDFCDYVSALRLQDHHPGIQGVGFALLVPASELARHTGAIQREGFPEYAIRPPGPRDPYTSIVFLERPNQRDARERVRLMDVVDLAMRWLPAAINQTATVTVENGGAPDVVATAGQITQVVVNLVTNAAKATPEGTRGAIVIRVEPGTPGMARLEVVDQGSGIEPDALTHIFDPFFTTSDVGKGTGLGLSICFAIVIGHGGTLTVRSEVGKGSTFRVELPAAIAEA